MMTKLGVRRGGRMALAALVLLLMSFASAQAQNPLVQHLDRGVVLVLAKPAQGRGISIGTGFFVAPGLVVTNRHVIEGAAPEDIFLASRTIGPPRRATVVAQSPSSRAGQADFAVLRLDNTPPAARVLPLTRRVERLQEVVAAGYPGIVVMADDQFRRMVEGERGAIPEMALTSGEVTVTQTPAGSRLETIIHTAQISGGNSGGPLVDRCGRVTGVNTLVRTERAGGGGRALTALKTDGLIEFLQQHRIAFTEAQGGCAPGQTIAEAASAGSGRSQAGAAAPTAPAAASAGAPATPRSPLAGQFHPEASPLARGASLDQVRRYADSAMPNRALAFNPETLRWAGADNAPTREEAIRFALERCEFLSGAACALLEVNGTQEPARDGKWAVQPQPSLVITDTRFSIERVPFVTEQQRRSWLTRYQRETRPKALALHPSSEGAYRTGETAEQAQQAALSECRQRNAQRNPERCFLYATDDRIPAGRLTLQPTRDRS
ncbi:MAG: hypothetical protein EAZ99_15765 [Alphaproteobacteria bacterium]|nr:MAG: hypothetical protein EAZ99_15765 [Alphaproteobacteria bacterium]